MVKSVVHGQGRIKTKLGLMLQPKKGLFFSALTFPSEHSLTMFVKSRQRSSSCSMLISVKPILSKTHLSFWTEFRHKKVEFLYEESS